jgi:3-oxoacyl-[acyl-carrier protein] reductase
MQAMDLGLSGKVAVVTGSSRGLGLASARALAAEGCHVVLCARSRAGLDAAVRSIAETASPPARLHAVEADVSTSQGVRAVIDAAVETFGGIDILVNNVGSSMGTDLLGTGDEVWHQALDQNLFPSIRASRLAVPYMEQRGGGAIIIIASIYGRESGGRMTYNVMKAAEISLAKSLAQQLAPSNIRVNSVSPGSISFEGGTWWKRQQENPAAMAEFVKREIPMGRFGRAEEVGDVVAFLSSARASWISGTSVVVDGCQSRMF